MGARQAIAIALCALLLTTGLTTAASTFAPGDGGAQLGGDATSLEAYIAGNEDAQASLAEPLPADSVAILLAGVTPEDVERARTAANLSLLAPSIGQVWSQGDGREILELLRDSFDEETGTFAFETATSNVDRFIARLMVVHLAVLYAQPDVDRQAKEGLRTFLEEGELPEGWEVTAAEPATEPATEPSGEAGAPGAQGQQEAEVEWTEPPEDPEPVPLSEIGDPDGDGVKALQDGDSKTILANCPACGQSFGAHNSPLTATFPLEDLTPDEIEEATMRVRTFDVDWWVASPCGTPVEKDVVYLNGHRVSHLTGTNDNWHTTPFNLNPDWLVEGTNSIQIYYDVLGNGCWRATTSWIQLQLAGPGEVQVTRVETDQDGYNLGDTIEVDAWLKTDAEEPAPYPAAVKFNLYTPDGAVITTSPDPGTQSVSLTMGEEKQVSATLPIPTGAAVGDVEQGLWTVEAVAFDKDALPSDEGTKEVRVGTDLSVVEDDIEIEAGDPNPASGSAEVTVSGQIKYTAATDEQQSFQVKIHALRDGQPTDHETQSLTVPGQGSGTLDLAPTTIQIDTENEPGVRIVVDSGGDVDEIDEDNNEVDLDVGKPKVTKLEPRVIKNFLLDNDLEGKQWYTATTEAPEIGGEVEKVRFTVKQGGAEVAGPTEVDTEQSPDEWRWTWDPGAELTSPGTYEVEAVAISDLGIESDPETYEFSMFELPGYMQFLADELSLLFFSPFSPNFQGATGGSGGQLAAKYFGNPGLSFSFEPSGKLLGVAQDVVGTVGDAFCLDDPEIKAGFGIEFKHDVQSDKSQWTAELKVKGGIDGSTTQKFIRIFGKSFGGSLAGQGTWTYQEGTAEWDMTAFQFQGEFSITFTCEALEAIVTWLGGGPTLADLAGKIAGLTLSLTGQAQITIAFDDNVPVVFNIARLKEITVRPGVDLGLSVQAGPDMLNVQASLNGNVGLGLGWQHPSGWLFSLGLCPFKCGVKIWGEAKVEIKIPWTGKTVGASASVTLYEAKIPDNPDDWAWEILEVEPTHPPYAYEDPEQETPGMPSHLPGTPGLLPPSLTPPALPQPFATVTGQDQGVLIQDGPLTRATVSLGIDQDGNRLVLFDRDNPAPAHANPLGIPDIGTAERTDGTWGEAGVLAPSELLDAFPEVAVADDGTAIAAWEQFTEPFGLEDDMADFLDTIRVVYAVRDADGTWSQPEVLAPADGVRQHLGEIAISPDGETATVSWESYADPSLGNFERTPYVTTLSEGEVTDHHALAEVGEFFGRPQVALTPTGQVLATTVEATPPANTTLALHVGDPTTDTWLEPIVLAAGAQRPMTPDLALSDGRATVAWVEEQGGTHAILERTTARLPAPSELPLESLETEAAMPLGPARTLVPADPAEPATVRELELVAAGGNLLDLVWYDHQAELVRSLAFTPPVAEQATQEALDPAALLPEDLPGEADPVAENLTKAGGAVEEARPQAVHEVRDLLEGIYNDLEADYDPAADEVVVVGTRQRTSLADGEPVDVMIATHPMGGDLTVTAIESTPANPAPGQAANLSAVVRNTGERVATPSALAMVNHEVLIGTGAVGVLQPGQEERVNVSWTAPNNTRPNQITARLHPFGVTGDADPTNDELTRFLTVPDLAIASLADTAQGTTVGILATVENQGVLASAPATLVVRDAQGDELGTGTVASLGPGQAGASSVFIDPQDLTTGANSVQVELQAGGPDLTDENHHDTALLSALPDLAITEARLGNAVIGNPTEITVVLANKGPFPTEATTVGIQVDGQPAASLDVPSLAPGQRHTAVGQVSLTEGGHLVRVEVDPTDTLSDGVVTNDVVTLFAEPEPAALPELNEASLVYTTGGIEVKVHNRGPGLLTGQSLAVYRGAPADPPVYGAPYVTKVDNRFGITGTGEVPGLTTGSKLVASEDLVIRRTSPDAPVSEVHIGDLAPDETISLRLDPLDTPVEQLTPTLWVEKPLVSIASPSHPDPGTARTGSTATFELTVAPGHTASGYSYVVDDQPGTVPDTTVDTTHPSFSVSGLEPGTYYAHVRAQLPAGWTATDHFPVHVAPPDTQPPTTSLTVGTPSVRTGPSAYTLNAATPLTLTASDDASLVSATHYAVDGGPTQTYQGPFTVPTGDHELTYWSVDEAGNQEAPSTVELSVEDGVDTVAPETEISFSTGLAEGVDGQDVVPPGALVSLTGSDPWEHAATPPSGLDTIWVQVDGGPVGVYTGAFPVPSQPGAHTITWWGQDRAGNEEAGQSLTFEVDDQAPEAAITDPAENDVVVGPTTFVVEAEDDRAGVSRVDLLHEGQVLASNATPEAGTYELTVDTSQWPLGNNNVTALVTDEVGNMATEELRVYVVSRTVEVMPSVDENRDRLVPEDVDQAVRDAPVPEGVGP